MKKNYSLILGASFLLMLNSCSNEHIEDSVHVENGVIATIKNMDNNDEISETDISRILEQIQSRKQSKSQISLRQIKEIVTIKNKYQKPLMYIVNYKEDKGFTIVSGTKKYNPILAEVKKGNFDPNNSNNGFQQWLNTTQHVIDSLINISQNSPEILSYRSQWIEFEENKRLLTTKNSQISNLISSNIVEWERQGYDVIMMQDFLNSSSFSQELKDEVYTAAYRFANQQYDRMMYSFVLTKKQMNTEEISPLVSSIWGQGGGYNIMLDQINGQYPPIGCVGVAIAQIMKYHKFPLYFNWSEMYDYSPNQITASFLKEVAIAADTKFALSGSASNIDKARKALTNVYKYSPDMQIVAHSRNTAIQSIKRYGPVYMRGESSALGDGHAWVCDGFQDTFAETEIVLKGLEDCPPSYTPTRFNTLLNKRVNPYQSTYFHMNWGWEGSYNGMYYEGTFPNESLNFSKNRKNLINIHK